MLLLLLALLLLCLLLILFHLLVFLVFLSFCDALEISLFLSLSHSLSLCVFLLCTGSSMSFPVFFVASLLYKCWTWFSLRDCFPCFHLRQMIYFAKVSSFCISEWRWCYMNLSTISLASHICILLFFYFSLLSIIYTLNTYIEEETETHTHTRTLSICVLICVVGKVTPGWYLFVYYSREQRVRGFSFALSFSIYLGFMKNCKENGRVELAFL